MSKIMLEISDLQKNFGDRCILDIDHLSIYDGERIGLIGENGAGKSTLFSILSGEMSPDSGDIRRYCTLSIIHQIGESKLQADGQLKSEFHAPEAREGLSGGEQTRRRIAGALSTNAPLILADEPTTDLDIQGIEQLKRKLQAHTGAMVLISHDRDLLNALCTRILHLEAGKISDFPGSYANYQAELTQRRTHQQFEYDQYRTEQQRLKTSAQRMQERASQVKKTPSRMGNSEARLHRREASDAIFQLSHVKHTIQTRMEHLEEKQRPSDLPNIRMSLGVDQPISAKTALTVRNLSLNISGRSLLSGTNFTLPTASRTALMGPNGCGKTTLIRALLDNPGGSVRVGGNIRFNPSASVGCFDQAHDRMLDFDQTALENVMSDTTQPESTARTVLARLNLCRDDVFKMVRVLSGGERAKVALARLLLSSANVLILDEPTNHIDLFTMQALEGLLSEYAGTLLFVSHDRAFVSAVATRILHFESSRLEAFEGTLSEMNARQNQDRHAEQLRLEISTLEMRMAALMGRMASPKKGDNPLKLNEEYAQLSEQLRMAKQSL